MRVEKVTFALTKNKTNSKQYDVVQIQTQPLRSHSPGLFMSLPHKLQGTKVLVSYREAL